jgi:FlaA1/EpsC-like NDP-sugar epimerase
MTVLIGGSGTIGHKVAQILLDRGESVTIFSRSELLQKQMKVKFPKLKFIIGDVRDFLSVRDAIKDHDTIYLFAALKHIDICEEFPEEAIKTNVNGALNVLRACNKNSFKKIIYTSTDKAYQPCGVYGSTKLMAERLLLNQTNTAVSICRYVNVIGSRGSIVETFVNQFKNHLPITITDLEMTRFWMTQDTAAQFVVASEKTTGLNIPNIKASKITDFARAIGHIMNVSTFDFKVIGLRTDEKIHESLSEGFSSNTCEQYSFEELVELVKPEVSKYL